MTGSRKRVRKCSSILSFAIALKPEKLWLNGYDRQLPTRTRLFSLFLGAVSPSDSKSRKKFHTDLDVFLVRKLGAPHQEELAMGAVASGGIRVLNHSIIQQLGIPSTVIEHATERELREIARREQLYREGRPPANPAGRRVVLVDDGLATGATMLAAAQALRRQKPARIIVAVPVAASEACEEFRNHVDQVVCAATPAPFYGVGVWYEDFTQTTDDDVRNLLERAAREQIA